MCKNNVLKTSFNCNRFVIEWKKRKLYNIEVKIYNFLGENFYE